MIADFSLVQPNVSLIVSGGHTMLVHVEGELKHRVLGSTVDDAAGTRVDSTILQHDLDAETRAGVPGSWTVTLILASARGRVDFQLLGRP